MLTEYRTALQSCGNVAEVLDWKLGEIEQNNLPVTSFTDYIIQGVTGYDNDIEKIDNYIEQLKLKKEELKQGKLKAEQECAEYLLNSGIDKLEATLDNYSSITIAKAKKPSQSEKKIFVCELTPAEQKEKLVEHGYAFWKLEVVEVAEVPSKIKINKKRK